MKKSAIIIFLFIIALTYLSGCKTVEDDYDKTDNYSTFFTDTFTYTGSDSITDTFDNTSTDSETLTDTNTNTDSNTSSETLTDSSTDSDTSITTETDTSTISDTSTDSSTESDTDTDFVIITDTEGNKIKNGSYTLSINGVSKSINAKYLIDGATVNINNGTYKSSSDSTNKVVFLVVNGGSLNIKGTADKPVMINKSGSVALDGFVDNDYIDYGINSAILVAGSYSSLTIDHADINTTSNGSSAIFSTNNSNVIIKNSTISTSGSNMSRGLNTSFGGYIIANYVSIETQGEFSPTLATGLNGGVIKASNMTLETDGADSPLLYSTGSINIDSSTGNAKSSQIAVIDVGSTVVVDRCDFTCDGKGNKTGTSESNLENHIVDSCGVFIYKNIADKVNNGINYFTATNSNLSLTSSDIPMFYCTNVTANIVLNNNTFVLPSNDDYFIMAEETSVWGTKGTNGGKINISLTNQNLNDYKAFRGASSSSITQTPTDFSKPITDFTAETWW